MSGRQDLDDQAAYLATEASLETALRFRTTHERDRQALSLLVLTDGFFIPLPRRRGPKAGCRAH